LQHRRIVLFLSRLDPKKGIDLLLRAFARVRTQVPNASLVVAGSGDDEFVNCLKADAVSLGISADVLWPGFLLDGEKYAALADADVFVLPSYSENFGIAAAEAMAAGLPVVVSQQVGIHRDIAEARAGIVVPCRVEDLASALTRLLTDSTLRQSTGQRAREFARQRYSSDVITRKLVGVYNRILN
jgi:glycosyltransferase involved in cell wall biosynthesis